MPLINSLKNTTLKNLRYSGLGPAVQKDINDPPVYNSESKEVQARSDDAARLTRAIVLSSPKFTTNLAQLNAIDKQRNVKPVQRPAEDVPRGQGENNIGRALSSIGAAIKQVSNIVTEGLGQATVQTPSILAATLAQAAAEAGTHFVYGFGTKGKYIPGSANPHVLAKLQGRVPIPSGFDEDRSELKEAWSSLTPKPGASHPLADGNLLLNSNLNNPPKISAYDFVKSKSNDTIGDGVIKDFTKVEETSTGKAPLKISNEVKKETRVGLSTNRKLGRYTSKYIDNKTEFSDQRNLLEPTQSPIPTVKDHIKFKFGIINPDETPNINLYFRAFLSSFTDNYQGSWNNTKYLGRAEDFYTYQGFNRTISIGFKAAAFSRQELKPIYKKLVMLASTTAPTYSSDNGFMRGTLVTSTVGDYLVNQPGFISSVDYSWQTDYPWEVTLGGAQEDVQQLPHVLDCTVAFTPIHRFAVQTGQQHFITNPDPDGSTILSGQPITLQDGFGALGSIIMTSLE